MKLHDDTGGVGFYESFSDIIFATMAIFILLMTLFLVLAQESGPVREAQKKLEAVQEQVTKTNEKKEEFNNQSIKLESKLEKLSNKNVEIAIAVDKTGSMEEELYNLKHAIEQLAKILPKIMDRVSISIVAYHVGENDRDNTVLFPMTLIQDYKKDNGASYKKLTGFLSLQRHKSGSAPVLSATKEALSQFNPSASARDHQVFMLLGDVGPYEITYNSPDVITPLGKQRAASLVSSVKQWVDAKNNRNIIILFSGRDEVNDRSSGSARRYKHHKSMELFKQIADESGQPKAYTENQSSMLVDFLVAALKRK